MVARELEIRQWFKGYVMQVRRLSSEERLSLSFFVSSVFEMRLLIPRLRV
jgi:hypothetical protein